MTLRQFEQLFKALSDKQRLRILALLSKGPQVVADIKGVLHLSMSTVSQHLTILRNAGLVIDHKEGRWVHYSLTDINTDKKQLAGIIHSQLKKHFETEDEFIYDYKLLLKQKKPEFEFKTKK